MDYDELIRQGKVKRIFRAKRKLTVPKIVSHVTQRAAGKEPLFLEDDDYLFMLANMKDITEKRSLDMFAFCLMPNHVHLFMSPREDELHEAMRDLFSRYAMRFNRKYKRKGHLFAGPYRQAVCLDDTYLLAASLYIHINPARAGLVSAPLEYRWSSARLFCEHDAPRSFVKPDFILRLLGKDRYKQKKIYSDLLERGSLLASEDVLEREDAVSQLRKALAAIFPAFFARVRKKKHVAGRTGVELLDEEYLEREIKAIKSGKHMTSPKTMKARRFLIEQLIARGYKRAEIASMIGVSIKTVYNTLKFSE